MIHEFQGMHALGNGADVAIRMREAGLVDEYQSMRSSESFMKTDFNRDNLSAVISSLVLPVRDISHLGGFGFEIVPTEARNDEGWFRLGRKDGWNSEMGSLNGIYTPNGGDRRQLILGVVAVGIDGHEDFHLDMVERDEISMLQ